MPNANGVPVSVDDLLGKLATFLIANGWTEDRYGVEGSGVWGTFHLGGLYAHLRASDNEIVWPAHSFSVGGSSSLNLYCGNGFNPANAWAGQGSPSIVPVSGIVSVGVSMILGGGPYSTYYFFCDPGGDNVVVVVEKTPGVFVHLGWGSSLAKAGAWTGGMYFFGSSDSNSSGAPGTGPGLDQTADCPGVRCSPLNGVVCFVRADVDSYLSKWISIGVNNGAQAKTGDTAVVGVGANTDKAIPTYGYNYNDSLNFQYQQTSLQDGRANLLPVLLYVQRDGSGAGLSLLGSLPNIFWANAVGQGYPKASMYSIGAKNYRLFPNFAVVQS